MSFFAVKRKYFLKFERRADGFREGTADIIRLLWSASFNNPEFRAEIFSSSQSKIQSLMPLARLRISLKTSSFLMLVIHVLLIVARVWIFTTIITLLLPSKYDQVVGKDLVYMTVFSLLFPARDVHFWLQFNWRIRRPQYHR